MLTSTSWRMKSERDSMFNSLISLLLYNFALPIVLIGFAILWLYFLPEYWWGLMLVTIGLIFWFVPTITNKFEKFK